MTESTRGANRRPVIVSWRKSYRIGSMVASSMALITMVVVFKKDNERSSVTLPASVWHMHVRTVAMRSTKRYSLSGRHSASAEASSVRSSMLGASHAGALGQSELLNLSTNVRHLSVSIE
jgi:hypothetical protein